MREGRLPQYVGPIRRWALAALFLIALPAQAQTLPQRIDAHIAAPRFASASWGISVVSLDDGRTVYAHDDGRLLLPASTAKLYTAAFALDALGPDYRTHTDVLAGGEIRKGRLHGPLVLRGRGDPTLSGDGWADRLATELTATGLRRIDGGVVGDDTAFAGPPIGAGWEASDLQTAYGAEAGALTIDENTLTVTVPGNGVPRVVPEDAAVAIDITGAADGPSSMYRAPGSGTVFVPAPGAACGGDEVCATRRGRLSMPDPALAAARRLRQALVAHGIRVDGEARSVRWPVGSPGETVLASVPSPPLLDILRAGLKRSQNLYLQSVFLLTGLETGGTGPAEERAAGALRKWLAGRGIGPTSVTMNEGTGLSRHDLTTAASLTRVLADMASSPLAERWKALLPVAGVDGTLATRMRGTAAERNVVAKTGSMSFVNGLAGYVTTKAGQRLAFAIVLNNYAPSRMATPAPPVSAEVDAIAVMMAEAQERL